MGCLVKMKSDDEIIKQFGGEKGHRKVSESGLGKQHKTALEDFGYWSGDKTVYRTGYYEKDKGFVVINRIMPYVSAVNGFMIQLARKPIYQAMIDPDDSQAQEQQLQVAYSEYLNGFSDYCRDKANADHIEAVQNLHMLICGYGAIDTSTTYEEFTATRNPDGEIIMGNLDPFNTYWDPFATETNLLDARWVYCKKQYALAEAMDKFETKKEDDFEGSTVNTNTGDYQFYPGGIVDRIGLESDMADKGLVNVYYYQWWEREKYWRCKNPAKKMQEDAQSLQQKDPMQAKIMAAKADFLLEGMRRIQDIRVNLTDDEYEKEDLFSFNPDSDMLVCNKLIYNDLKLAFAQLKLDVKFDQGTRRVYYTAVLSGKHVFDKFKNIDQQGFTVKFKTGNYDIREKRWFGMVAALKEPQKYSNKALTELLYVIASNSKGGVMYEESAVPNPQKFEKQYATTTGAIMLNDGAVSGNKIMPKAQAALPNGYDSLYPQFNDAIAEVVGIDRTFLGSSENKQETASLQRQRIKQVVTTLASYFNSIVLYQKEHARLMITFMRVLAENSPGRIFSITGQDGGLIYKKLSIDSIAPEYDVQIGEAPDSATQKEEAANTMLQLAGTLIQFGQNIYPVAIKYLDGYGIKQKDIQELIQIVTPPQPTPEEQQKQAQNDQMKTMAAQLALKTQQAEIDSKTADAQLKKAGIPEKQANTALKFSDAQQRNLENEAMVSQPFALNVSI